MQNKKEQREQMMVILLTKYTNYYHRTGSTLKTIKILKEVSYQSFILLYNKGIGGVLTLDQMKVFLSNRALKL